MITLNNINLSSIDLSGIDLRGIKLGLGGRGSSGDGFPQLPGDVTRWHFGDLTNEMMAAMDDPRIEDADHKGRFLSFKNFLWSGMSGVGGYADNFSSESWKKPSDRSDITWTSSSFNITRVMNTGVQMYYQAAWEESESVIPEKRIIVKGLEDGQVLRYMNVGNRIIEISQDGIYTIPSFIFKGVSSYHGYSLAKKQESCDITIEQLPLYPGSLVFDGVDDYGICDNFPILTKEKGYTVVALRKYITPDPKSYLISNGDTARLAAFLVEGNFPTIQYWNFGAVGNLNYIDNSPYVYQTSKEYNGRSINKGDLNEGIASLIVCKYGSWYSNAAIWELVILDHDATEEELTKIKDYFVKTYPWLFPDQAWTVVGKTNEDTDRATIANITGNGNDLVLSNFGFAENSGYGLYGDDFFKWLIHENRVVATKTSKLFNITSIKEAVLQLYYQSTGGGTVRTIPSYTIKVTGLTDGQKIIYKSNQTDLVSISSDGIHKLPSFEFLGAGNYYGFAFTKVQESCDITIEQIPEYEGYLVTDGVDDKIMSSAFRSQHDFTVVGEWQFLPPDKLVYCGISKGGSLILYNSQEGLMAFINQQSTETELKGVRSLKAICSDGRVYNQNWDEIRIISGELSYSDGKLLMGWNSDRFTKIVFKNLGIYNNKILSKDDCIKAYNYLQTLKAK